MSNDPGRSTSDIPASKTMDVVFFFRIRHDKEGSDNMYVLTWWYIITGSKGLYSTMIENNVYIFRGPLSNF